MTSICKSGVNVTMTTIGVAHEVHEVIRRELYSCNECIDDRMKDAELDSTMNDGDSLSKEVEIDKILAAETTFDEFLDILQME
jgi:hypothetical protein